MVIQEADFKIKFQDRQFIVYVLKNKKELKKKDDLDPEEEILDNDDRFKNYGYYNTVQAAIKRALLFRKHKKYPGKELITFSIPYYQQILQTLAILETKLKEVHIDLELKQKEINELLNIKFKQEKEDKKLKSKKENV